MKAKRKGGSYLQTISISKDLKERMNKVENVNWSALCADAIEEYLSQPSDTNIKTILERLKKLEDDIRNLKDPSP